MFASGRFSALSAICLFPNFRARQPAKSARLACRPASRPHSRLPARRPEVKGPDALPESPSAAKKKGTKSKEELEIERREQSQKVLGVIPQYSVTSRRDAPALTSGEKFHLMARGTINPFEFVATGLQAGLSQATDEFPGYGQGAAGYGKRYGAALADQTSSQFFSNFFYPVLFKEDPRYFRLGEGTVETSHSLFARAGVRGGKRRPDPHLQFLQRAWRFHFGSDFECVLSQPGNGVWAIPLNRSAIALVYGSAGGLIDEFWPDIQKKWAEHRQEERKMQKINSNARPGESRPFA